MQRIMLLVATALMGLTSWATTTVETTPGKLSSLITDHAITTLKIRGEMDARDFKFIAENLDSLSEIDLSEVGIVAYSNSEMAILGTDNNFAAASIPCTSFFGKPIISIALPTSLKSIGYAAFAGCDKLTTVTFPSQLDSIGSYAFSSSGITSVTLPAAVRVVGDGAFSRCSSLTTAQVDCAIIGKEAFYADTALSALTLEKAVKVVGEGAFKACTALESLQIEGTGITSIGEDAFARTSMAALDLSSQSSLSSIGSWALANTPITAAKLPKSLSHMGEGVFFYAPQLESAALPDSIADVPAYTFAGAETLTSAAAYHIPATAQEIGAFSFYNACAIQNLAIPKSVSHIGTKAMAGMTGFQSIAAYSETSVPELADSVWAGVNQPSVNLDVKTTTLAETFAAAPQWQDFHILKDYLLGDVNSDGTLDVADVSLLVSYILGNEPSPFATNVADTNSDGIIDVSDVSTLIDMVLSGDTVVIRRTPRNQP